MMQTLNNEHDISEIQIIEANELVANGSIYGNVCFFSLQKYYCIFTSPKLTNYNSMKKYFASTFKASNWVNFMLGKQKLVF